MELPEEMEPPCLPGPPVFELSRWAERGRAGPGPPAAVLNARPRPGLRDRVT